MKAETMTVNAEVRHRFSKYVHHLKMWRKNVNCAFKAHMLYLKQ